MYLRMSECWMASRALAGIGAGIEVLKSVGKHASKNIGIFALKQSFLRIEI